MMLQSARKLGIVGLPLVVPIGGGKDRGICRFALARYSVNGDPALNLIDIERLISEL